MRINSQNIIYSAIVGIIIAVFVLLGENFPKPHPHLKIEISEFVFCLILMNFIFFTCCYKLNSNRPVYGIWYLIVVFCVFAFWDTDYFSFARDFLSTTDFRDLLYHSIRELSVKTYSLFRLIIWGTALMVFYKIVTFYDLNKNIAIGVFSFFYLLTFSYARVSLAIVLYFWGLSILISEKRFENKLLLVFMIYFFAFAAHRSILVPILLSPIAFLDLNRKKSVILLVATPILAVIINHFAINYLLQLFSNSGDTSNFSISAQKYLKLSTEMDYNWKFTLIKILRNYSFYILNIYLLWKFILKRDNDCLPTSLKRLLTVTTFISCFASVFLIGAGSTGLGLSIIGYRYLYMTGIPLVILLSYSYQQEYCTTKDLVLLLLFPFVYSESFIIGKILS